MSGTAPRPDLVDVVPVTPVQAALLADDAIGPGGTRYVGQIVVDLAGDLDADRLHASAEQLVSRHASLRTGFSDRQERAPLAFVLRDATVPWSVVVDDATGDEQTRVERQTPFDLRRPPLVRFLLVRRAPDDHALAITFHHAVLDAWSLDVVLEELMTLYAGSAASLPPAVPFRRYVQWLVDRDPAEDQRFWTDVLAGATPTLVGRGTHDPGASGRHRLSTSLPPGVDPAPGGRSLAAAAAAAWGMTLSRYTGSEDVVFGCAVSARPPEVPGIDRLVGMCVTTMPVRLCCRRGATTADVVDQAQAWLRRSLPHQHVPLAETQRWAGAGTLLDTIVVVQNAARSTTGSQRGAHGVAVRTISSHESSDFPVAVSVVPATAPGAAVQLALDHDDTVDASVAANLLRCFTDALTLLVAGDDPSVDAVGPGAAEPDPPTAPAAFLPAPRRLLLASRTHPDRTAMVGADRSLSFAELSALLAALGRGLVARGVRRGDVVAVCADGWRAGVAQLAVQAVGACVLMLDPAHPPRRRQDIMADARPAYLLTTSPLDIAARPAADVGGAAATVLDLAELSNSPVDDDLAPAEWFDRLPALRSEDSAYLTYTSGSTGGPKGVLVPHQALSALLDWFGPSIGLEPSDRVLRRTSVAFDASVWELWAPLVAGGSVAFVDDRAALLDPAGLAAAVSELAVTVIQLVPSIASSLLTGVDPADVSTLRMVCLGGERLSPQLADALRQRWEVAVVNLYGPSEATVQVTAHPFDPADPGPVALGEVVPGTGVRVLDGGLRPVPDGWLGALYLSGQQLATGYHRSPGLTAVSFVADPWGPPGARMYATGDLVTRGEDGLLHYHGRVDRQVKISGTRVEPGEIELVLTQLPQVREVAVWAEKSSDRTRLVAAVVLDHGDAHDVRNEVAARVLPSLVPEVLVLPTLPRLISGKTDYDALAGMRPQPLPRGSSDSEPDDGVAGRIAVAMSEVLTGSTIGIDDDFLLRGGDSVLAVGLVSRLRNAGLTLTPADVLTHRTPRSLAEQSRRAGRVRHDPGVGTVAPLPVVLDRLAQGLPLTDITQTLVLPCPEGSDRPAVEAVLQALLDHHAVLSARLRPDGSLEVPGAPAAAAELLSTAAATDPEAADGLAAAVHRCLDRLDPARGPLLCGAWLPHGADGSGPPGVVVRISHLGCDAVSQEILAADWAEAWRAQEAGLPVVLAPVPVSYLSWSRWLHSDVSRLRAGRQRGSWTDDHEHGSPSSSSRAADDSSSSVGARVITAPGRLWSDLRAVHPEASPDQLAVAVTAAAMFRWRRRTGQSMGRGIRVDVERRGRPDLEDVDLSRTIGWLTAVQPVCVGAAVLHRGFDAVLAQVISRTGVIVDDGIGFGVLRHLAPPGDGVDEPWGEAAIMVNHLRAAPGHAQIPAADVEQAMRTQQPARALTLDLITDLPGAEDGGQLRLDWGWRPSRHRDDDVAVLVDLWVETLTEITRERATTVNPSADPIDQLELVPGGDAW